MVSKQANRKGGIKTRYRIREGSFIDNVIQFIGVASITAIIILITTMIYIIGGKI